MGAKPRLLLLDAGAVIHAHRCGGWAALCTRYEVIVPAIVAQEATFYLDDERRRVPIDLEPDFTAHRIQRYAASLAEFAATSAILPDQLRGRVHDGELEALTYLRVEGEQDTAFVTADGGAIEATVLLKCSDVAISLESALQACGITKRLPYAHTEAFVKEAKARGGATLVQFGMGAPAASRAKKGAR